MLSQNKDQTQVLGHREHHENDDNEVDLGGNMFSEPTTEFDQKSMYSEMHRAPNDFNRGLSLNQHYKTFAPNSKPHDDSDE